MEWASLALAGSVVSDAFGTDDPGFLYNLFADKLLGLGLVSDDVSVSFLLRSPREWGVRLGSEKG